MRVGRLEAWGHVDWLGHFAEERKKRNREAEKTENK
jgi:hypothetical protein